MRHDPPLKVEVIPTVEIQVDESVLEPKGGLYVDLSGVNCVPFFTTRVNLLSIRACSTTATAFVKEWDLRRGDADPITEAQVGTALQRMALGLKELHMGYTADPDTQAVAPDPDALWEAAKELALAPDLLDRVALALRAQGLAGERENALLLYLAATSRLQKEPISVFVKGPSSGGKSYLLKRVLALLPEEAYLDYTTVSPRYLAYCPDDLRHKIVTLYEGGNMSDENTALMVKSLLSEHRIKFGTVEKGQDKGHVGREVIKDGPTSLFTSTTHAKLDGELETRALTIAVSDDPAQSRAILRSTALAHSGDDPAVVDVSAFHALQRWLALRGKQRVVIPYAKILAERVPTGAVRVRRDFGKLLNLIAASALLHQAQRGETPDGAVIATLDDYERVRGLVVESFAAAVSEGITEKQRQAVVAVTTLQSEENAGARLGAVAKHLGIDKSSASRRLAAVLSAGYVVNLETREKQPARYVPGEPLPEPVNALPTRAELEGREEQEL
jgi:hypothetical protein